MQQITSKKSGKSFLFIVNSFPPVNNQNSLRALEISKRLTEESINPIILTRRAERREPKDYALNKEVPKNLEICKTKIIELKRKFSLRTLFFKMTTKIFYFYTYVHWVPFGYKAGKKILKNRKNIRFIYSTGPPYYSHIIAYLLKKKLKIPLLIEYRDPWNFNPYGLKKRKKLNHIINSKVERRILKSADTVIAISEPLKKFLILNFPEIKQKPFYIIANGLNIKDYIYPQKSTDEKITISFIGKLYGSRNIEPLLKIITDLKKQNFFEKLKFSLKIFGKYDLAYLNKKIQTKKLKIVTYAYILVKI
jgi:glycosyltransferase involved in cell wall biosynthesis